MLEHLEVYRGSISAMGWMLQHLPGALVVGACLRLLVVAVRPVR